jgi:Protein of unknown function (DUF1549)/Protein of unknown function (DUF1553)
MRCVLLLSIALTVLAEPASAAKPEVWWSLRPLKKPDVPKVDDPRVRNPIDAFILTKLKEKGLTPAAEADPRTLIRRLYFDLIGLPPTPAEVGAFLKKHAAKPDEAYEALVDRLLASPHYGERWARHWMDAVHFAETHGHDQDRVRPNAWPYRDYLIEAFNSDRPYARFVQEQIAADALFPNEPERVVAMGLLAAGPWDESSLRDIREDSIDRQIGYYLDRDDMVSTVMSTFNSLTVHCARCHDHKFDPISQDDYYSLQAVFAGVGRANRPYDADPAANRKRVERLAKIAALERRDPKLREELLATALQEEINSWGANVPKSIDWTILEPTSIVSASGATLTKLTDQSVLAGGMKPERDRYTVEAVATLKGITAFRLELLTDDSLPLRGPGRQGNGNLHLNEFVVRAAPKTFPERAETLGFRNAVADFDQQGWGVVYAIDGKLATAWGIYPEVSKPHQAVFELKKPVGFEAGTLLTFVLEQQHGGSHLIGRFRLSVTTSAEPLRVNQLPDAVARALTVPFDKRTDEQKLDLAYHYVKEKLQREIDKLPPPKMVFAAAANFAPDGSHKPVAKPRAVQVLKRGDINRPLREAKPGALGCVADVPQQFKVDHPDNEAARRVALAKWLTDAKHPLTWRSIVNRIWHLHFGKGIVDTPNDFGKMGGKPTHPELLDWLAVTFRDGADMPSPTRSEAPANPSPKQSEAGGSIKKLHKLIVMSATYRQASTHNADNAKIDSDNRFLWRMNRTRLDAEQVRDAMLLISERLNRKMGGPSDQQFSMKPGIHVTPLIDYLAFGWDKPEGHRRSIYRFVFRTLPDPLVDCLDGADASQLTPARNVSITPLQALALLNNEFTLAHSKAFAASLEKASADKEKEIALAVERVWGRPATKNEIDEMKAYAAKHGLANLGRLLFNSNEFLFVN